MASPVSESPRSSGPEPVENRLRRLEAEWKAATQFLSDPDQITSHPAFRQIVGLGTEVVPLLLRDLQSAPALWVWALPEITGENPVPDEDRGDIRKMSAAWVAWGRNQGIR
jgi:hypothetical protein